MSLIDNYKKYKWFYTNSGKLVVGGKNAVQNEEMLHLTKKEKKDFIVMHTSSPGSPFSIILDNIKKISKNDLEETAVFTACFYQAWKSGKKTADVDIFRSSQLNKPGKAKVGTWQVLGEVETVTVPLELVLTRQEGVLRAVPEKTVKKGILKILPGKLRKDEIITKIQLSVKESLSQEELFSALPAGGIRIEKI